MIKNLDLGSVYVNILLSALLSSMHSALQLFLLLLLFLKANRLLAWYCRLSVCPSVWYKLNSTSHSKCLNNWIGSTPMDMILQLSTPTPILSLQTTHLLNHRRWCHLANTLKTSCVVLCDTWNWSDDNDTASGIEYRDTITIPETEMNYAISMSFRIHKSRSIGINMQWQLFLQEIVLISSRFV